MVGVDLRADAYNYYSFLPEWVIGHPVDTSLIHSITFFPLLNMDINYPFFVLYMITVTALVSLLTMTQNVA